MRRPCRLITLKTVLLFALCLPPATHASSYPLSITDSSGRRITIEARPERVVSLVPSVTEILMRIGASDRVVGITHHSVLPPESAGKAIVGGFSAPDMERVAALDPDLVFHAGLHRDALSGFKGRAAQIHLQARSIEEGFERIRLIGRIFGREEDAARIIAEEERRLRVTTAKVAAIPAGRRLRVMRVMGREEIMAPGDDSFQNEYIRAAGGIAPELGRPGEATRITLDEWLDFDPQVVYGCKDDRRLLPLLGRPVWREVEAVRNGRVLFFPCELTCRVATHPGYFVSWLASRIYEDGFSGPDAVVLPQGVVKRRPLMVGVDHVLRAEVVESDMMDFRNKTLLVTFRRPVSVLSTLDGYREGITTVANHHLPPPLWGLGHRQGLNAMRSAAMDLLGLDPDTTAMLFTGADMDNIAVSEKSFRDLKVVVLVTAGVTGNSMRMGSDTGGFYEPEERGGDGGKGPGTINIVVLTNASLTPPAITRAVVSATEAKTAALQDLDIRSSYSPGPNQATGTGTDNIIVAGGEGPGVGSSGGHTKMGELIAGAVYDGVKKAVQRQNGLVAERSVFQRLRERGIGLERICPRYAPGDRSAALCSEVERVLLEPRYAGFIKALMAMSDDHERGLLVDTSGVELWAGAVAGEIAGRVVLVERRMPDDFGVPPVLAMGLEAVYAGALERLKRKNAPAKGLHR